MLKHIGEALAVVAISVLVTLTGVGGAEAATPINSCQTLSVSGTYVLTANLSSPPDHCLLVAANFVTIDLNGFEISGNNSNAVFDNSVSRKGTVVRNGTIRDAGVGIFLVESNSTTVDNVILFNNTSAAAALGTNSTIMNSAIYDNGNAILFFRPGPGTVKNNRIYNNHAFQPVAAVRANAHMLVIGNTIVQNATAGIDVGEGSTVTDNVLLGNGTTGFNTIATGSRSVVSRNTVIGGAGDRGILAGDHSTVNDNVVNNNTVTVAGIDVGASSVVQRNTALNNGADGIDVTCPSTVKFNTALGNTGTNLNESGSGCVNLGNNAP